MLKKVLLVSLISLAFQMSSYAHDEEKNSSSENLAQNTFTWGKSPNHVERDWKFIESEHFQIYYYQGFEKLAKEASDIGESAYFKVTEDLKSKPSGKIPVMPLVLRLKHLYKQRESQFG